MKDTIERFGENKEQKSNYNELEYTGNGWANERLTTDKEQIEEMAKELKISRYKNLGLGLCNFQCDNCKTFCTEREYAKQLVNAGYHKTIWHKVADGDLPKKAGSYLCYVHIFGYDRHNEFIDRYGYSVELFYNEFSTINSDVIAWTELPEYKE